MSADDETSPRWAYTCLYDPDAGRMAAVKVSRRTAITRMADGDTVEIEADFVPSNADFILEGNCSVIPQILQDRPRRNAIYGVR